MSAPTVAPDSIITPVVTFDDDALTWTVACPSTACGKRYSAVRLSEATAAYEAHRGIERR